MFAMATIYWLCASAFGHAAKDDEMMNGGRGVDRRVQSINTSPHRCKVVHEQVMDSRGFADIDAHAGNVRLLLRPARKYIDQHAAYIRLKKEHDGSCYLIISLSQPLHPLANPLLHL